MSFQPRPASKNHQHIPVGLPRVIQSIYRCHAMLPVVIDKHEGVEEVAMLNATRDIRHIYDAWGRSFRAEYNLPFDECRRNFRNVELWISIDVFLVQEIQVAEDLKAIGDLEWQESSFPSMMRLIGRLPACIVPKKLHAGRRLVQVADQCIQRYKKLLEGSTDPPPTFFTKLYNAGSEGLSDVEIRDDAFVFVAAGSDTTATTLTYLIWAVCRHPGIKEALVQELSTLPEGFTDQHLRGLRWLEHVIDETLRLYGAAPAGLKRVVPPGGAVLGGHHIPAGVTVTTQAYTLHRDPGIFPEPERFNPSRWSTPTKETKGAFMPFGGGSRICIGLHLARRELRLATACFFRAFPNAQVSTKYDMADTDMDQTIYFVMAPKGKRCLIECP